MPCEFCPGVPGSAYCCVCGEGESSPNVPPANCSRSGTVISGYEPPYNGGVCDRCDPARETPTQAPGCGLGPQGAERRP
jgi:hypothetical protein